jgi:hypothetical protein
MYGENLARLTSDHLRTHIGDYLDTIASEYTGNLSVPLVVPKRIDYSSAVGGMIQDFDKILPEYGIDVLGKTLSQDDASLWSYEYAGQINGLVHGGSQEAVDFVIGRHCRAVEYFIMQHRLLHEYQDPAGNFSLLEFAFGGYDLSGAEDISSNEGSLWLAGFSINVSWFTSEVGPDQHA